MEGSEHLHTAVEIESLSKERRGPGLRLRQARERCGLSVASIADTLHLEQRVIEALEADDYDQLPPVTYVRGYLSAYARLVNLPVASVLQGFERVGLEERSRPLTSKVGRGGARATGARRMAHFSMSSSALLILAFAAVLISGWMFWTASRSRPESPRLNEHESATGVTGQATAAEAGADAAAEAEVSKAPATDELSAEGVETTAVTAPPSALAKRPSHVPNETGDGTGRNTGALAPVPSRSGKGPVVAGASAAAEVADHPPDDGKARPEAVASAAPSLPINAALETLKVDASGQSWVDVEDAGGQRLIYGLLKGGESRRITGRPPFDITIGDATQVMLRHNGTRVDLGPYTHDKVARFTLTATRN